MQNVSKAKARGKQVSNNLSISDAQTSENFCKGEDDATQAKLIRREQCNTADLLDFEYFIVFKLVPSKQ